MNILITGATGTLGSSLVKECINRGHNPICLGHSEARTQNLQKKYLDIPIYNIEISHDIELLEKIINQHHIDYIIHAAAMKHIGICENNPSKAIDINILGSRNVISVAQKYSVRNVIAISTDKAINPSCVYGCSKLLMEKIMLEHGYSTLQGVNFFFSNGSVLHIWDKAVEENNPILINKNDTTRYFIRTKDVANKILDNLDSKGQYICLDSCSKISLHQLAKAFCSYHNYTNVADYPSVSAEKTEEEIPENMKIIDTDQESLVRLIAEYYNGD